jgi:hypothetical protein
MESFPSIDLLRMHESCPTSGVSVTPASPPEAVSSHSGFSRCLWGGSDINQGSLLGSTLVNQAVALTKHVTSTRDLAISILQLKQFPSLTGLCLQGPLPPRAHWPRAILNRKPCRSPTSTTETFPVSWASRICCGKAGVDDNETARTLFRVWSRSRCTSARAHSLGADARASTPTRQYEGTAPWDFARSCSFSRICAGGGGATWALQLAVRCHLSCSSASGCTWCRLAAAASASDCFSTSKQLCV